MLGPAVLACTCWLATACNELGERDCVDVESSDLLSGRLICGVIDHQSGGFQVLARTATTLELYRFTSEDGFKRLVEIEGVFDGPSIGACPRFSPGLRLGGISAYHRPVVLTGNPELSAGLAVANTRLIAINNAGETEGTVKPSPDTSPVRVRDMFLDAEGIVVVAGARWSSDATSYNDTQLWVAGIDGKGQIAWEYSGEPDEREAVAIIRGPSGQVIARVQRAIPQTDRLVSFDAGKAGQRWSLALTQASHGFDGLASDGEQGAYLSGRTGPLDAGELVVLRVSSAGVVLFETNVTPPEGQQLTGGLGSAVGTDDDGVLVAQPIAGPRGSDRSTLLVGASAQGEVRCMQIVDKDHGYSRAALMRSPTRIVLIDSALDATGAQRGSRLLVLSDEISSSR